MRMEINTGGAQPKGKSVRCTPFAAKQKLNKKLSETQAQNVITPSDSPWASPVRSTGTEKRWVTMLLHQLPQLNFNHQK